MKNKLLTLLTFALALAPTAFAQEATLSLDSCRALAIKNNKDLRMSALKSEAAHWQRKSALTNYLPKISAVGTYQHTSREISLLNDEQKSKFSNMGTNMANSLSSAAQQGLTNFQQWMTNLPTSPEMAALMQNPQAVAILTSHPTLAAMLQNPNIMQQLAAPFIQQASTAFNGMLSNMASVLDAAGQNIVDAFRTDTRNMTGAAIMLTQPLYMGGKIRAYDKITGYAERIAHEKHEIEVQDVIVSVDEAYWRIIALQSKKELAEGFLKLVQKLDGDVEKLIEEGMATRADGLSVKVKVNEAEVAVIQVNNGLVLSRMALAQICGLPLDAQFRLADEGKQNDAALASALTTTYYEDDSAVARAMANRPELRALDLAAEVKREQVKVARSEYMPNLALTAGYLISNPSVFNGFEKKFGGMWSVGVMLKVPILTWGDRIYKVRQAKVEAEIAATQAENVRERITLQVNQNQQKLQEAQQRLNAASRSLDHAEENLRMANLGLREGVISVSNVLEAQTAWLMAHSTLVEAQVDLQLADLYLNRAMGTLSE